MAKETKIGWTHHTFNPWRGCTKCSPGCDHCYAATLAKRNPAVLGSWGPKAPRVMAAESYWKEPLKWNADAEKAGERRRVFCASLADVFEDYKGGQVVNVQGELVLASLESLRMRLFLLIDATPHLDWLLLTKRPQNITRLMSRISNGNFPDTWNFEDHMPNVRLGTTIENQAAANSRIRDLFATKAAGYFFSCEPLIEHVRLWPSCFRAKHPGRLWVIAGGESGKDARTMHPDWARSLRDQCESAGVPFFFKQWGEWAPQFDADCQPITYIVNGKKRVCPDPAPEGDWMNAMLHVGTEAAGRLLDGREWNEFPTLASK